MSKVALKTDILKEALKSYDKVTPLELKNGKSTTIPFNDSTKDLLQFLQEAIPLTSRQKAKISGFLFSNEKLGELESGCVNDLYDKVNFIGNTIEPILEIKINNKWYPLLVNISKFRTYTGSWVIELSVYGQLGGAHQYTKNIYIGEWNFEDKAGKTVKKTFSEILKKSDLRVASKEAIDHSKKLSALIPKFSADAGKVFDASGTGLVYHEYWGWSDINIGWKDSPATVIVEPILENRYANNEIQSDGWQLPFVRVFSLKHKNYIFVDVEDIEEHIFHKDGKNKIVLPKKMFLALESIFNAQQGNIFGDLFHGRHGGIVVLANGPSGVGKTLTAEVFAEFQSRPLYSMEMSEIGTSLKDVEVNLQKIFARAKKWNAVLLFDEADIFLSERVASDLERSAIVGVFLRLLDYYEGTFFLTTNRGEGIDTAFKSRVTLYLNYPELSPDTRYVIWQNMIKSASLSVTTGTNHTWIEIINTPLNGRQIRNQVRLIKLMYPDGNITTEDIYSSLEFAAR